MGGRISQSKLLRLSPENWVTTSCRVTPYSRIGDRELLLGWERYVALASPCQHQDLWTPSKGKLTPYFVQNLIARPTSGLATICRNSKTDGRRLIPRELRGCDFGEIRASETGKAAAFAWRLLGTMESL